MVNLKFKKTKLFAIILSATILFVACRMFSGGGSNNDEIKITSLALGKSTMSMKAGSMDYIAVSVKPATEQKNITLKWTYDKSVIECDTSSAFGVTITALKEGQTSLKCSYGGYDATCIITVSGFAENYEETVEPYIYSNTTIIQTSPGVTEKVYVSLYGGSAADIDGYTWTCDNPSVCSIEPTGQYCLVTAKDSGYARIKINHVKSQYPYYMGIYVFSDATKATYITTGNNIVTMKQGDAGQTVSVSLVNGKESSLDSQFAWEIVDGGSDNPVQLESSGNKAVVTPVKGGSCTLRVTHPDAVYPLEILCRVLTIVKNVYIKPSATVVSLHGDETQTITFSLENIKEGGYDFDAYEFILDDYGAAEIVSTVGNEVVVKGKANGSCKLVASHEKAAYSREVLLIVDGQLTDAVDASCYITTSQNYIRTKVGAEGVEISVALKGGDEGDESGFVWAVGSSAADGSGKEVVKLETANGSVMAARMAAQAYAYGTAYMEPLEEGTAVITVTHPKVVYPTEILVKVLDRNAVLEEPLYFAGSGLVKILNGESAEYTVQLKGVNKSTSDDAGIEWSTEDSRIRIAASGNTANINAPPLGTGCTTSNITISHNKADTDKKVLVMTADDQETLDSMKALYSDKLYYNIEVGGRAYLMTNGVGFNTFDFEGEYIPYDFSMAKWTVKDSSVASVEKAGTPLTGIVTGLKTGTTQVTVSIDGCSCEYTVTVYPKGTVQTEPEVYFTTGKNVITLGKAGQSETAYVTAINLPSGKYGQIEWESSDESVATVIPNGTSATVTAAGEGESVVSVSHPDSQNTLKIYIRVGSEYIIKDSEPVVYISAPDVMTMLKDDQPQRLDAALVNHSGADKTGFSFSIDNNKVAEISSQSANGIAYVKPVAAGQAEITISHTATEIRKKVLVVVGNTAEELAGITYLTTSSNVVSIGEGNTRSVSVSVKNADSPVLDGYYWESSNPAVVGVTASGANAVLTGNSIGTAMITVSNSQCKYPLQIIAQCVDPIAAAQNPYIQLSSSVLTVSVGSGYTNVTAELVGGDKSDFSSFAWASNDSSVCAVFGQNETGKLRALKAGTTYITVSHPKAAYPQQILVVCDEVKKSDCYISVPASIISMKPTDSTQTVTATLVNGESTDKYAFAWSCDVYDIVDLVYSANTATITPKAQGQCTITITHPKAAYTQQIVVTVQEYSDFAFPNTNTTITQGEVKFFSMQIPNTKVATHVEYSVDNAGICSITGTKATAQITAVGDGTTTVRAKLVASSSGVVQAQSEMLVYVKKAAVNAVYITSVTTIYTLNKDKSLILSAALSGTGVTNDDIRSLKWTTNDTDIVQITGISSDGTIKGQQIYITALKSGEALITCSHEKASSDLQFFVVVPGEAEKTITLNKTYLTIQKDGSGSTLKATIENSESSNDYHTIDWKVESATAGIEVCRIMGSGQTVTIFPLNVGEADIIASLPDSPSSARCQVKVEAGRSMTFEQTAVKVQPFKKVEVKYTVSPPSIERVWSTSQADSFFTYEDKGPDENGNGTLVIEGIGTGEGRMGTGILSCRTVGQGGGAVGTLSVTVGWNYAFSISKLGINGTPDDQPTVLTYTVNPADADIYIDNKYEKYFNAIASDGKIIVTPLMETPGNVSFTVRAVNQYANNEQIKSQTVSVNYAYKGIKPTIAFLSSDGNFSKISDSTGNITVGDGENPSFSVMVSHPKIEVDDSSIKITANLNNSSGVRFQDMGGGNFMLSGGEDVIEKEVYKVTEAYRPVYTGNSVNRKDENYTVLPNENYTDIPYWKESIRLTLSHVSHDWAKYGCTTAFCGALAKPHHPGTSGYITLIEEDSGQEIVSYYTGWVSNKKLREIEPTLTAKDNYSDTHIKRLKDDSLIKEYPKDEFEKISYWYNDQELISDTHTNTSSEHQSQLRYHVAGINKNHVTARLGQSESTECKKKISVGYIRVTFKHGAVTETADFSVSLETRWCPKTQTEK